MRENLNNERKVGNCLVRDCDNDYMCSYIRKVKELQGRTKSKYDTPFRSK